MPFSDPHRHFEDVLTAIEKIEEFAGNMDFGDYTDDDRTKAAAEKRLQILAEAIIRLEDESPGPILKLIRKRFEAWVTFLGTHTTGSTTRSFGRRFKPISRS
jgi:hypothetical protein